MQKLRANVSRDWWCLKTWDQFHVIRRISKGGLTHLLFFLSSNISLEFYAKFEGRHFLETDDVSRPGTTSVQLGGSTRVPWRICSRQISVWNRLEISRCFTHVLLGSSHAQHAQLSFYRRISVWNFMQNLRVNVFSKLAMSQDLRPIPCG